MATNITFRKTDSALNKPSATTVKNAPLSSLEIDGNFKSIKDNLDEMIEGGVGKLVQRHDVVSLGGQTIFDLPFSYTPGTDALMVFVNGVLGVAGSRYTETSSTRITMTPALSLGDKVTVMVNVSPINSLPYNPVDGRKDLFVAGTHYTKNTTTSVTLSSAPAKSGTVKVFFDGVYQNKDTYYIVGNVVYFGVVGSLVAIPVDTVEVQYEIPSQFVGLSVADNAVLTAAQNNAQASANDAAASFDSFDDRYLGAKSVAPTVDNDGNALLVGAKYFNSTTNKMYVRNSSNAWQLDTADSSTVNYASTTVEKTLDIFRRGHIYADEFMTSSQWADVKSGNLTLSVTAALQAAVLEAQTSGKILVFRRGKYLMTGGAAYGRLLELFTGATFIGEDPDLTVLTLASGAAEPPSIIGSSAYVRDVRIIGIGLDGGQPDMSAIVPGASGFGGAGNGQFEFSCGVSISRGDNIRIEHGLCKNLRGDGYFTGQSAAWSGGAADPIKDLYIAHTRHENILREAIMLANVDGADIRHTKVIGQPYVAAIDVERHHVDDTVRGVNIDDLICEFSQYRRAVSCLASASTLAVDDGKSKDVTMRGLKITNGQIDIRSFSDVEIDHAIISNPASNFAANQWISQHAIYIDPNNLTASPMNTWGGHKIRNCDITHPTTIGGSAGFGVYAERNANVKMSANTITDAKAGGVFVRNCRGFKSVGDRVWDVGTSAAPAPAFRLAETCDGASLFAYDVRDTRATDNRGVSWGVQITGYNNGSAPYIGPGQIINTISGDVEDSASQTNFATIVGVQSTGNNKVLGAGRIFTTPSATWIPGSIPDTQNRTTTVTVAGAGLGDFAIASVGADLQGLLLDCWVVSSDTVRVRLTNRTGAAVDPGTLTVRVRVTNA